MYKIIESKENLFQEIYYQLIENQACILKNIQNVGLAERAKEGIF